MVKDPERKFEPILPLIFYNGAKEWKPLTVEQLFADHPYFEFIRPFLPNFDLHFTNVKNISTEQLVQIQFDFFRSVMVAMANRYDWNLLLKEISVILAVDEEDNQVAMGHYFFGIIERLPKEVIEIIRGTKIDLTIDSNKKFMTTLEMLREEGRIQGEKRGEIKGIQRGAQFGKLSNQIVSVLNCMSKLPDLPIYAITLITEQSEEFVLTIQKGFKNGNEKRARKVIADLFKDFGELREIEVQQLEAIFKAYLPKFRKK